MDSFRLGCRALGIAAVSLLASPAMAPAATKNGITPLAPKANAKIKAGTAPTFRMRVKGPGSVWVHVCPQTKKDKEGLICSTASIGEAKKSGNVFKYKPRVFDFPEFWLNSPGTYYWQVHRIDCSGGVKDCRREGPVVRLRVVA